MILFIHPSVFAFYFCHRLLVFNFFLSHWPFSHSSPELFLLFIPHLVFAWLIILTKSHYLTLVLVELCPFFFRLLLLKCQHCFEFWSCPPACLQPLSAWCSLQRQSACFLCHQPRCGWKHRVVSELGWVLVEPTSVRSSQSVLKDQRPVHRWSSQQWCTHLQVAQSSPCVPSCVMEMSRETLSEVSLKSFFLLPFLQVLVPCRGKQ